MTLRLAPALATVLMLAPLSAAHAEVRLTIRDGAVSLVAVDATVREILAEWARVGQTKIVNGEKVAGGPVSIQLTETPEDRALDIILRTVSGYVAAPRPVYDANASRYDRILVLPTSTPPRNNPAPPPAFAPPPQPQPRFVPPPAQPDDDPDDADDVVPAPSVVPPQRGPVFNTFPPPQAVPPNDNVAPPAPSPTPTAPVGVARPGMIVQPPPPPPGQQPGVPPGPQ